MFLGIRVHRRASGLGNQVAVTPIMGQNRSMFMRAIEVGPSGRSNFHTGATWAVSAIVLAIGVVLALGAAPASAAVSATYTCTASLPSGVHSFTSPITISAHTPASVEGPGATVKMTNFEITVTIPQEIIEAALRDGVTWFSGKFTTFYIDATDAKTATRFNMAGGQGITIPKTNLPNPAQNLTLMLHSKTVGTWTASQKGTMIFTNGDIRFTLNENFAIPIAVSGSPSPAVTVSKTIVK